MEKIPVVVEQMQLTRNVLRARVRARVRVKARVRMEE